MVVVLLLLGHASLLVWVGLCVLLVLVGFGHASAFAPLVLLVTLIEVLGLVLACVVVVVAL